MTAIILIAVNVVIVSFIAGALVALAIDPNQ